MKTLIAVITLCLTTPALADGYVSVGPVIQYQAIAPPLYAAPRVYTYRAYPRLALPRVYAAPRMAVVEIRPSLSERYHASRANHNARKAEKHAEKAARYSERSAVHATYVP